jgi:hypothetical protein
MVEMMSSRELVVCRGKYKGNFIRLLPYFFMKKKKIQTTYTY